MKMFHIIFVIIYAAAVLDHGNTYRILGVFPLNGRSHEMMFEALMKGLARHGHQVDVITHFPLRKPPPNYNTIVSLKGTMENIVNNFTIDFVLGFGTDVADTIATLYGNRLCELMALKEMQELIHNPPKDPPYDVLITEAFGAHCFMGIGHHFNIPIIAASSAVEYPWVSEFTGNNDNPAIVPNSLTMFFGKLNFWQRLTNMLIYRNQIRKFNKATEHYQTEAMRKYINPNMPNIRDIEKSVALTLVNSHPVLYSVKPMLPSIIQVGGLHVEETNSNLPRNLKKWMDDSKDGVVYFTFGSMVLIETLPEDTLKIFYSSFAKLDPVRILMKVDNTSKLPPGLPKNVLTLPWMPQQPILAHPNTKVFITHGGLMGSQEALYYGMPMIGIPLFADQPRNIESFVVKNITIKILLNDITEETLDAALKEILFNPIYRKSAKYYSKLFRDRPRTAMEDAIFWIEYIIRNGPHVLRPPALELTWWQIGLLDVYGFIFTVFIVTTFTLYYVLQLILKKYIWTLLSKENQNDKKIN